MRAVHMSNDRQASMPASEIDGLHVGIGAHLGGRAPAISGRGRARSRGRRGANTTSMSCSVNSTAIVSLGASSAASCHQRDALAGAMPAVGSSISSSRGWLASAMASSTRFRSP